MPKMQNRNYTSIEGVGYKPVSIRPISYHNKNRLNKISRVDREGPRPSLCKLSISDTAKEIKKIWRQIWELKQKPDKKG